MKPKARSSTALTMARSRDEAVAFELTEVFPEGRASETGGGHCIIQ